jgi:hypothetical protein
MDTSKRAVSVIAARNSVLFPCAIAMLPALAALVLLRSNRYPVLASAWLLNGEGTRLLCVFRHTTLPDYQSLEKDLTKQRLRLAAEIRQTFTQWPIGPVAITKFGTKVATASKC